MNGKQLNATANGGEYTCPYDVIDVEPSKTYLFRFVGAQGLTYLRYTLAGHSFTTVQVDGGSYTKPLEVDHIEFGTGQRYAALLTTKSVEELNGQTVFWANISSFFRPIVDEGYALLRYNLNNDTSLPSEAFAIADATKYNIPQVAFSTFGWIDSQLQPLTSDPYPTTVDQRISSLSVTDFRDCFECMASQRNIHRTRHQHRPMGHQSSLVPRTEPACHTRLSNTLQISRNSRNQQFHKLHPRSSIRGLRSRLKYLSYQNQHHHRDYIPNNWLRGRCFARFTSLACAWSKLL